MKNSGNTYSIAIYPGDGIGLEVTPEAVSCMEAAASRYNFTMKLTEFDWGHRHWKRTGKIVPDDFLAELRSFDAIFLGAIGDPKNLPDHVTLKPLIDMRQTFDQYACLRPATLLPGMSSPLSGKQPGEIDILIVRENSEGEYVEAGGRLKSATPDAVSFQTSVHTRKGVERILRFAFDKAATRRRRLTMATKSNALKYSMVMWDELLEEVSSDYPRIESEKCHVDALAMNFVRCPEAYDVVVASNLFGDILSDLAGAIAGSLGVSPSANLNPERAFPSLFEPVHGSAPDIAGRGIANPVAAIRSAAMMLEFLGEEKAAAAIEAATLSHLTAATALTPDLGGKAGTREAGEDIAGRIAGE